MRLQEKLTVGLMLMVSGFALPLHAGEAQEVQLLLPAEDSVAVRALYQRKSKTYTKPLPWISGIEKQIKKSIPIPASGIVQAAGNINQQLGYVWLQWMATPHRYVSNRLLVVNKKTGESRLSLKLAAEVEGESVGPGEVGGFTFQVSPGEERWVTVLSAGFYTGTKYYREGRGYMRFLVSDRASVRWVSPPIRTSGIQMQFSGVFSLCVLARPLAGDVDGDGYRDIILWRREYGPSAPPTKVSHDEFSGGFEVNEYDYEPDDLFPWTLKKQETVVYRYLPAEGKYSVKGEPVNLALYDGLWYPAALDAATGRELLGVMRAWAGCDDSERGFAHSEFYKFLDEKEKRRLLLRKASAPPTVTVPLIPFGRGTPPPGKGSAGRAEGFSVGAESGAAATPAPERD